ncbi:MAG: hypothetical protein ABH886_02380 [Candidatus Desantisbacteria bacterium]
MNKKIQHEAIFQLLLLPLLIILYLIKNFTFPVSESLQFLTDSTSFKQLLTVSYHPPIYFFILRIFQLFIPDKIIACQMVGVISIYLAALLLFHIIKKQETDSPVSIKYWLVLFFITFVPIYNSMFLLDIDNTIMTPFLLFFINYFLDNVKQAKPWKISLLLVLLFWIKEVMYPPVIIFIFIITIIELGIKNGFIKFLQILIISSLLSAITYGLYSHLLFNNWGAIAFNGEKLFYKVTTIGSSESANSLKFSLNSFKGLISILCWINPLLCFIIIINLKKILSSYKNKYYLLFIFIYGFILLTAWGNPGGYIKYHIPLISFLLFLLYPAFIEMLVSVNKKFIFALLILIIVYFFSGDYLYQIYTMNTTRSSNSKFIFLFTTLYLLLPVLSMVLFSRKIKVSTVALIFLIAQNFGLLGNQILADYSTNYHYGDRGIYEVINFLKANHLETKVRFGTTPYLPVAIFNISFPTKKEQISPQEKEYFVDRDYSFIRNAVFLPNLKEYTKIKQIGNYQIWKKNGSPQISGIHYHSE